MPKGAFCCLSPHYRYSTFYRRFYSSRRTKPHPIHSHRSQRTDVREHFPGLALNHVTFLISAIIQMVAQSHSYRNAESNFDLIAPYLNRATDAQIVELLTGSFRNSQVYDAAKCAKIYLPPLLKSHGHLLDREVRAVLREALARYQVPPPKPAF